MAKRRYPNPTERVALFRAAWSELAADTNFAGMTLAEFETATNPLVENDTRLKQIAAQNSAALREKYVLEGSVKELLRRIGNAVRGHDGYGEDSALYRAMGFVPFSERKSGLTRATAEDPPPAAGEAA